MRTKPVILSRADGEGSPRRGACVVEEILRHAQNDGRARMRRIAALLFLFILAACSGARSGVTSVPGRGAIAIEVAPNPIVAHRVSGDVYEFPVDVTVRETGGRRVDITRVDVSVTVGALNVGGETWDAAKIAALGYPTSVPARGTLQLHLAPRRSVPDERYFPSLNVQLKNEGRARKSL